MSVREAQLKIDSAEFAEWCAYSNIKPFYLDTQEYLLATVAAILTNVHSKKSARSTKPEDFLPRFSSNRPEETAEEMLIKARSLFHGYNK